MEMNKEFGRYLLVKYLGSGATSDVYLAHDTKLERDVALKILKSALVSDQVSFGRFMIEAQAASKLFHDNIATVLDMGEVDGRNYIAMRYIDGSSLDQHLKQHGPLPWETVRRLAQQIGSAITYAHSQGYIHRDIKPNNIMVDNTGNFVLTDFGLTRAMLHSGMTSTSGAVLGTPPYIPPEIWNGEEATALSDLYSFACVIDETITGRALFSGETTQEIITKHLVKKPGITGYPPSIHHNIQFIIQKALSKKSGDRFPDIRSFLDALLEPEKFDVAEYLAQIDSDERSESDRKNLENLKKKKRRKVITTIVGIGIVILAILCLVGSIVFKEQVAQIRAVFNPSEVTLTVQAAVAPQTKQEASAKITQTSTATVEPTIAPAATITLTPTSTVTPVPQASNKFSVALGSGVEIEMKENASTGLTAYFYRADGSPIQNKYVQLYTQKQDLSGNWVTDQRIDYDDTDNTGAVSFSVAPGQYIIRADFIGYNWGSATDVNGQANIQVEAGKRTEMVMRLSRLLVGFMYADGSVYNGKYVQVYTQQLNISNQWVTKDRVDYGDTDNSGVVEFDLTPGNYIARADFLGYKWGDAVDVTGESNLPLEPGKEYRLIFQLGKLIVVVKDTNNQPVNNKYIQIYYQNEDINSNPTVGDRVDYANLDNTGTAAFDLTPGKYVVRYDDKYYYNIEVQSGKTTTNDGNSIVISN